MTLSQLTVSSSNYKAYASLAEANKEIAVSPARSATWAALSDDNKKLYLVAATRRLDMLRWKGKRAGGATQTTAWPREGLFYEDGTEVADDAIPEALVRATALLAATIAGDADAADAGVTSQEVQRVKAGTVEVEFVDGTKLPDRKPLQDESAYALIEQWLLSSVAPTAGAAYGTDGKSSFDDQYERNGGFA